MQLRTLLLCCSASAAANDPFNWDSIPPSRQLQYHPCYSHLHCARLSLPLDHLNASDPRRATIAIAKLPAVVPASDFTYAGPIIVNPGGPGGSGVDFIRTKALRIRSAIDKPTRHYDIVSFDPRGVGRSLPRADCFPEAEMDRAAFLIEARGSGLDQRIPYALAMMHVWGQRCAKSADAMAYFNTPSVARDMLDMVEQMDQLRHHQLHRDEAERRPDLKRQVKPARLQYLGFSYGTVLGNFFASMFPGHVGRMVLDGVVDANDFVSGPGWLNNTIDADETFSNFLLGCSRAGPTICALARADDDDDDVHGSTLRARFTTFLTHLHSHPIPHLSNDGRSIIITAHDVLATIASSLHSPLTSFKRLATTLDNLMSGNPLDMAHTLLTSGAIPPLRNSCSHDGDNDNDNDVPIHGGAFAEPRSAVVCNDGDDISAHDASWWRSYVRNQTTTSTIFGAMWSSIRLPCAAWPFRPNWRFNGPFATPAPDPAIVPHRPAAPILFLSNRLDPVTPLSAARAMARTHPRSVVLVQESLGHCVLGSATSSCINAVLADYFDSGAVPDPDSTCAPDCRPWDQDCPSLQEDHISAWFHPHDPILRRGPPLILP